MPFWKRRLFIFIIKQPRDLIDSTTLVHEENGVIAVASMLSANGLAQENGVGLASELGRAEEFLDSDQRYKKSI